MLTGITATVIGVSAFALIWWFYLREKPVLKVWYAFLDNSEIQNDADLADRLQINPDQVRRILDEWESRRWLEEIKPPKCGRTDAAWYRLTYLGAQELEFKFGV